MLIYYYFLLIRYLSYIEIFLPGRSTPTTNLLLELSSYLVCSARPFCFKVFVIKRVELVPINIVIDKQVLYRWGCCWNHIRSSDDVWNRVCLFHYEKPLVSRLSCWPLFDFNYTICGMDTSLSLSSQEFDQDPSILRKLSITIFAS